MRGWCYYRWREDTEAWEFHAARREDEQQPRPTLMSMVMMVPCEWEQLDNGSWNLIRGVDPNEALKEEEND